MASIVAQQMLKHVFHGILKNEARRIDMLAAGVVLKLKCPGQTL
jgi:hypothetical protein